MKIYEIENKIVEIKIADVSRNLIVLSVQVNVDEPVRIPVKRKQFFGIDDWLSKVYIFNLIKYYSKN